MADRKLGVFICHCGGNISDYVDVEQVRKAVEGAPGVQVARTSMFTCSDAAQEEIIGLIKDMDLDGIVIASCSPKLHLNTFRQMCERAGLNPYQYVQVNIREQCSWAHTHNMAAATEKAIRLVRAGIAKDNLTEPLSPIEVKTYPAVAVIGSGISGMRAALAVADAGIAVHLIEKDSRSGGLVAENGRLFPSGRSGSSLIGMLESRIKANPLISTYYSAEIVEKKGSVGDFHIKVRLQDGSNLDLEVGAIIVATGSEPYQPKEGEFGFGSTGVVTLKDYLAMVNSEAPGELYYNGRKIRSVAYVYCVGSRQSAKEEGAHTYCSRYCCSAAVNAALITHERFKEVCQFHLYRDIRTYGQYEDLYHDALKAGSVFIRFADNAPPEVSGPDSAGRLHVRVKDLLTAKEEIEIEADLVVLVTGLVPRQNKELVDVLKLPVGREGFFNEIHPKLRPVETVVDGVFIAGCCQGPKTVSESVTSSMAASAKAAAMILTGKVSLEPFVAEVDAEKCDGCGQCVEACPYEAISMEEKDGASVAVIKESLCKGEGACVPVCPQEALEVKGYTHEEIRAMIEALLEPVEAGQA